MQTQIIYGILIPFIGTTAGAACVFFLRRQPHFLVQRSLTGFAAGVMTAASVWSLLIPAMERSEGLGRLEKWTPAMKDGKPTTYSWRLTMRLPVEKIAKKQDADPLLFLGGDPDKTFHEWASLRLRYDGRFTGRGAKGEGVVRVRFYIEPDGKITIGEVIKSPDEKLSREMIRVIRSSKGKWTPRKVRGVPQRTAYEYGVNFLGMAE